MKLQMDYKKMLIYFQHSVYFYKKKKNKYPLREFPAIFIHFSSNPKWILDQEHEKLCSSVLILKGLDSWHNEMTALVEKANIGSFWSVKEAVVACLGWCSHIVFIRKALDPWRNIHMPTPTHNSYSQYSACIAPGEGYKCLSLYSIYVITKRR